MAPVLMSTQAREKIEGKMGVFSKHIHFFCFFIFLIRFFDYLEIILLGFILLGFIATIFMSFFNQKLLCIVFKILPIIGLMLFLTFGSGVARLRLPVEPFIIILSLNFWINFVQKLFGYDFKAN